MTITYCKVEEFYHVVVELYAILVEPSISTAFLAENTGQDSGEAL